MESFPKDPLAVPWPMVEHPAEQPGTEDPSVVKRYTERRALWALQIFGGYGYVTEYGMEKDVRNALAGTVCSGTSEIQRTRIAAVLGL